jgi:hypothetical protein
MAAQRAISLAQVTKTTHRLIAVINQVINFRSRLIVDKQGFMAHGEVCPLSGLAADTQHTCAARAPVKWVITMWRGDAPAIPELS